MTERLALMVAARLVEAAKGVWAGPGIAKPLEIPNGEGRSLAVVIMSSETFNELLAASGWRKLDGETP